ncbi:MAG: hypothetical protein R3C14_19380 [Caldilineaceae bacterium]
MATTNIHVTAIDNELYILAAQPTGSYEICHIKSGYDAPVNYAVNPQTILPSGNYTLIMVGINWGGPQAFKVTVTTDGRDTVYTAPANTAPGANWTQAIQITV